MTNHRWERPRHLRRAKRLGNGTVVVTEFDASGQLVRSTYYYSTDDGLLTKLVEGGPDVGRPPAAA